MEGNQPSDAELVARALVARTAQERTAAFTAIADRYRSVVLRQCSIWFGGDPEAAQDVAQAALDAAFTLLAQGKGPASPDNLAGWLIEIARRRKDEYIRKAKPPGVQFADRPDRDALDQTADDDEYRSGSAVRRAHVTRLVERIVATLTDQQQAVYQLRFVEELTGRDIAGRLGITNSAASNEATKVQSLIADGFGALLLMQDGRAYCSRLAAILDEAAATHAGPSAFAAAPPETDLFTAELRRRITNHFNTCDVCDSCQTCNSKRRQLAVPYVPALTPILFAGEFRDRIDEVIRRVVENAEGGHNPSGHSGSGSSAPAVPAMAAGLLATAGGADAFVSRVQSIVHKASDSRFLPRWLRRAIPRDAGPGASLAVAAAAVVAAIVAVVVVASVASALTSGGSPAPVAGPGNAGAAAINTAGQGSGSVNDCGDSISISGTTATPASAASLAHSLQQVFDQCTGASIPVTCSGPPTNDGAQDNWSCQIPASDASKYFGGDQPGVFVTKATGQWIAYF